MKNSLLAALVAATLAFAHNAGAQTDDRNNDRYWGVGLGTASVDQSTNLYGSDDHDEPDAFSTQKALFGYIVRDDAGESGIGFEFGYVKYDDTNYAAFGGGASADIDMTSLYLAAVGTVPVLEYGDERRAELFGKLGLHSWDFEATGRGALSGKDGDDGSDWFYGVGVEWGALDRRGLVWRLEYEIFPAEPEITVITSSGATAVEGDYKASLASWSLIWRF